MKQGRRIPQPNYIRKLHDRWRIGALSCDVGYHHVTVEHDDWCGIFEGKRCDCDPDITRTFSLAGQAKNEEECRCYATSSPADHL